MECGSIVAAGSLEVTIETNVFFQGLPVTTIYIYFPEALNGHKVYTFFGVGLVVAPSLEGEIPLIIITNLIRSGQMSFKRENPS